MCIQYLDLILARWVRFRLCPASKCFIGENLNTIVFFDGQNIYRSAKDAWRSTNSSTYVYTWPSYDVEKLATALASQTSGRTITQIRFYTGVPSSYQHCRWNYFWVKKLNHLESQGIEVYRGKVNAHNQEKGVDVKLAIDLIRLTYEQQYEVAIILSQDRDFEPAVIFAKQIARNQGRQLVFESHFIIGPSSGSNRGIPGTKWMPIEKSIYDACLDPQDYQKPTLH